MFDTGEYYVMNGGIEPSGYLDSYNTPADIISISEGGNSCGYVQYNMTPFWSGGHCYTLHPKNEEFNYQYLYHFLKSKEQNIMAIRVGSGLPNIQKKDLERFEVQLPTLEKQAKIAELLKLIDHKCDLERMNLSKLQSQKVYFLNELFI